MKRVREKGIVAGKCRLFKVRDLLSALLRNIFNMPWSTVQLHELRVRSVNLAVQERLVIGWRPALMLEKCENYVLKNFRI
jgi:hypothetical protein